MRDGRIIMDKPDTNFGKMVLAEAKKLYGSDYVFEKCTIECEVMWWTDPDGEPEYGYIITFETSLIEDIEEADNG